MKTLPKARVLVTRFPYEARFGGEEVHTLHLMEALDQRGYEAFFLGSCPVLLPEFKQHGFAVCRAGLGKPPVTKTWLLAFTLLSPFYFLKAGFLLWKARKRWRIDTVYMLSFGEKLLMTPWARLFGMKVLWLEHARISAWLTRNPWRWVYKRWSRWAKTVVTSHAMLPYVRPWAQDLVAIPCSVFLEKAEPLPLEIRAFLKGGFALGTVARLTVDKGVDMLVHLVQSKPDVRLIIVGDGPLKMSLEAAAKNGRVLLLPGLPRRQLMSLYAALDLFVLASTEFDPFGMVAAEAMALGTPVLMTQACGFAHELHDEQEAWIVPARYVDLDRALKKALRHPEALKAMALRGKHFVEKHHAAEMMFSRFEALLKSAPPTSPKKKTSPG